MCEGSCFFAASKTFIVCLICYSHSQKREIVPPCGSILYFPIKRLKILRSFPMLFGHLYIFFGEMSAPIICPLFDWVDCLII